MSISTDRVSNQPKTPSAEAEARVLRTARRIVFAGDLHNCDDDCNADPKLCLASCREDVRSIAPIIASALQSAAEEAAKRAREVDESAVLCYVSGPWAYFTTLPLEKQWGDDWNDAPYEHNAGSPYEWREGSPEPRYEVYRVAWDGPLDEPSEGTINSRYSVEAINGGAVAWLRTPSWWGRAPIAIRAGTTFADFRRLIAEAEGRVYVLAHWPDSRPSRPNPAAKVVMKAASMRSRAARPSVEEK